MCAHKLRWKHAQNNFLFFSSKYVSTSCISVPTLGIFSNTDFTSQHSNRNVNTFYNIRSKREWLLLYKNALQQINTVLTPQFSTVTAPRYSTKVWMMTGSDELLMWGFILVCFSWLTATLATLETPLSSNSLCQRQMAEGWILFWTHLLRKSSKRQYAALLQEDGSWRSESLTLKTTTILVGCISFTYFIFAGIM